MNRDPVRQILENLGARYAVIGAIALAVRGAPRFTLDFDLLTTDRRVLQDSVWAQLSGSGVEVDVRKGDFDDPLAGVVRIGAPPDQIDIIVAKWEWQQHVIDRAEMVDIEGKPMPVALASDLILLKLDAGGPIDQQDVIQLLAVGRRDQLVAEVSKKIADLPEEPRALWQRLVTSSL